MLATSSVLTPPSSSSNIHQRDSTFHHTPQTRRNAMKVAVVGSGVAGLSATWLLNEHSDHEVHLYEAADRPGGHANTVTYNPPKGKPVDVDTGFIVFNPSTYPNFINFLKSYPSLESAILPTEMTFSVSRDQGAFEWAGNNLFTVFTQPSRLLDPTMWRLVYDVLRFNACARRIAMRWSREDEKLSIGRYLEREGYSDAFRDNYLIPLTAAVWSTPPDKCALDFPARTLIQFMSNHHLLQITGKPKWLTLKGGSRVYVKQIISNLPKPQLHLSTPITSVSSSHKIGPNRSPVVLKMADGTTETFDHVILACHSDTALELLRAGSGGPTWDEERLLGAFRWNQNEAVLHADTKLMPTRRLAWSCWNYLTRSAIDENGKRKANVDQVALTYWMNDLQHLPEKDHGPVLVTLNPPFEPQSDLIAGKYKYEHPVLDSAAINAQKEMPTIQNVRGISFAGAWMRYGFHEDGFTTGLRAATGIIQNTPHLENTIRPPFQIVPADREPQAVLVAKAFDLFESTSLRAFLACSLSFCLSIVRWALQTFIGLDLSHLDEP